MLTAQHINKSCKHSGSRHWVIKRAYKRKKGKREKKGKEKEKKKEKKREEEKQLIGLICVIDKSQDLRVKIPDHRMYYRWRIFHSG